MKIFNVNTITQIQSRDIDQFLEVYQDVDGVWRCIVLLKNGMRIPANKGMTLNEIQLSHDARIRLYAHISKIKNNLKSEFNV